MQQKPAIRQCNIWRQTKSILYVSILALKKISSGGGGHASRPPTYSMFYICILEYISRLCIVGTTEVWAWPTKKYPPKTSSHDNTAAHWLIVKLKCIFCYCCCCGVCCFEVMCGNIFIKLKSRLSVWLHSFDVRWLSHEPMHVLK